jgi:hypothetical protein
VHASGRDPALRAKASVLLVAYSRLVVACRRPCTTRFACSLLLNENADIELRKLCGQRAMKRANAWRRHCSSMAAGKIACGLPSLHAHVGTICSAQKQRELRPFLHYGVVACLTNASS